MMKKPHRFRLGDRFHLQTAAFLLITLPPIGLYLAITTGATWATWPLMILLIAGMLLGILASR
ncbi:MAG: hypothetical protein PVF70_00135 [Anaerolineales bacterium]|jgi:hypothetical protein